MFTEINDNEQGANILKIFADSKLTAGQGLLLHVLTHYAETKLGMTKDQVKAGLTYAGARDWIEDGPNGFVLLTIEGADAS
jgi:hypothetical protein